MPKKTKIPESNGILPRDVYLTAQLAEIADDVEEARNAGSWQAVAALRRQALATRDALDQTLAASPQLVDTTADLPDDTLIALLIEAVPALPPGALERLADAVAAALERRPMLAVVAGGDE